MSTTTVIAFTVRSAWNQPGEPYAGELEVNSRLNDQGILDTIFEVGNIAHPEGWQQASVSVGDHVSFWIKGEGWGVVRAFRCEGSGWTEIDPDDQVALQNRLATGSETYRATLIAGMRHRIEVRTRAAQRRRDSLHLNAIDARVIGDAEARIARLEALACR